jgi:hypothetical protein
MKSVNQMTEQEIKAAVEKELERQEKRREYSRKYHSRPDVREKHYAYSKERRERLKAEQAELFAEARRRGIDTTVFTGRS